MKKINLFAAVLLMMAAMLTSCGAKKQVAYQQPPYYQQPYQQNPYGQQPPQQNPYQQQPTYQQPPQQPVYNQPTQKDPLAGAAQKKAKEWESKGFEITGSKAALPMESALQMYYDKVYTDPDKYIIVSGSGIAPASPQAAKDVALAGACRNYAASAGSVVNGALNSQFSSFGDVDKVVGVFEQIVRDKILPYMHEELSVRRHVSKAWEVEALYILDEEKASQVRQQAWDQTVKETAVEQVIADEISKKVRELVRTNE